MNLKTWTIQVYYGLKRYNLKAVLEYSSNQIMRIRVFGNHSSILLENNFPLLLNTNSKKGIKWKIRDGNLFKEGTKSTQLFTSIISQLENMIKHEQKG